MKNEISEMEDLVKAMKICDESIYLRKFIQESNKIESIEDITEIPYSVKAFNKIEKITVESILKIHKEIMSNLEPDIAGQLRDKVVYVGGRTCPTEDLENRLLALCLVTPETSIQALDWHIRFETIHPFFDGNGRTGRLIYYWQCKNIGVQPILFCKSNLQWYYDLFKE